MVVARHLGWPRHNIDSAKGRIVMTAEPDAMPDTAANSARAGAVSTRPRSTVPLSEFRHDAGIRKVAAWGLGIAAFMAIFVSSFLGAFHHPSPHEVPIAVVAPQPAVAQMQQKLEHAAPGAFTLHHYRSAGAATAALRGTTVDAVFVLPGSGSAGSRPVSKPAATLRTASALGKLPSQVVVQTFTELGNAAGATVQVHDVVPPARDDPFGISPFFFSIGLFLPSFIGAAVFTVLFRRAPSGIRLASISALAVAFGLIDVAVADDGLGVLTGHPAALIGLAALTSLAFTAPTLALGRLLGVLAVPVMLLVFVVLGLPASGGPFGTAFLPDFDRAFSPGLPLTNAVVAIRNISYFGGNGIAGNLGVLGVWAGAGVLILAVMSVLERQWPRR